MSERSKEHAWKVCIPQKGIAGSNPAFSARTAEGEDSVWFHFAEQVGKKDSPVKHRLFYGIFLLLGYKVSEDWRGYIFTYSPNEVIFIFGCI